MLKYFCRFDNAASLEMCFVIVSVLQNEVLYVFCFVSYCMEVISSSKTKSALDCAILKNVGFLLGYSWSVPCIQLLLYLTELLTEH